MVEEWKDVVGYEGLYKVSSIGRVSKFEGRTLKQTLSQQGYPTVGLIANGKCKTKKVHRLVAGAFLENTGGLPQVNHKDGDKANNKLSNLEWCTQSHNMSHAHNHGLVQNGKPVVRECCETGHKTYFRSVRQACILGYGAHTSIIRRCVNEVEGPYRGAMWSFCNGGLNLERDMCVYVGDGTVQIHKGGMFVSLTQDEIEEVFLKTNLTPPRGNQNER